MHFDFDRFILNLKKRLSDPLPGVTVQYQMAPVTRMEQLVYNENDIAPRNSAVLALFFPLQQDVALTVIKRAVDNSVHSGQISFPGGQVEPTDKTLYETALRETEEELGIRKSKIYILGKLTPVYISPSNFNVQPFVGYIDNAPDFKPNEEVDRVISVSVKELLKPEAKTIKEVTTGYATKLKVPCFIVDGEILWGATAMMINELLEIIKML